MKAENDTERSVIIVKWILYEKNLYTKNLLMSEACISVCRKRRIHDAMANNIC
jgi:hypothetical protein